jgi:hypothetical protein
MSTEIQNKPNASRPLCNQCNLNLSYSEGKCRGCYTLYWIDEEYQPGLSIREFMASIDPMEPTRALPGSKEKLMVLCARARARLPLFHPLDNVRKKEKKTA